MRVLAGYTILTPLPITLRVSQLCGLTDLCVHARHCRPARSPLIFNLSGRLVQRLEQCPYKAKVGGSIPSPPTLAATLGVAEIP